MIKNVLIYGSCVSRDIFNLKESGAFKLIDYYARSSMASFTSAAYQNDAALDRITSDFRRRMVANDFSKALLGAAEVLESADVILIDLIDERFDLLALPSGELITHSPELAESGLLKDPCIAGFEVIKSSSAMHRELWQQGMKLFFDLLRKLDKLDSVLVNQVFWSSRFEKRTDTKFPITRAAIDQANQELSWMYEVLHGELKEEQFMAFSPALLTADESHRWGASPFHYCEQYYKEALAQIITRQHCLEAGDDATAERPRTHAPLVSSGAKVSVAAYRTDRQIFVHCSLAMDGQIREGGDFAFYLLAGGVRQEVRWYEKSKSARFAIPDSEGELEVVAFYKDIFDEQTSTTTAVKSLR
ncbi:hypothetical protein D3C81_616280 [compost metagenome]